MPKKIPIAFPVIAGFMLIGAVIEFPYVYYQVLRWVVFIVGLLMAYYAYQYEKIVGTIFFIGAAILFNPITPIHLSREVWFPIDIVCGLIFILSPEYLRRKG